MWVRLKQLCVIKCCTHHYDFDPVYLCTCLENNVKWLCITCVVAKYLEQRVTVKKSVKKIRHRRKWDTSGLLIHEFIRGGWTNLEMRNFKIFKTRVGLFTRLFWIWYFEHVQSMFFSPFYFRIFIQIVSTKKFLSNYSPVKKLKFQAVSCQYQFQVLQHMQ